MFGSKLARSNEEARLSKLLFGVAEDVLESGKDVIDDEDEPKSKKAKRKVVAAWQDEDDVTTVGDALRSQGRTVPDGGANDHSGNYTDLLKRKYETLVGNPEWASLDRDDFEDDEDAHLLQTAAHLGKSRGSFLKNDYLYFKRTQLLNADTHQKESIIKVVQFHPTSSVALVAGNAGTLSLLAVDGKHNEKLHCVSFRKFPILCSRFMPDGNTAILGSNASRYYSYDLPNAKATLLPLPEGVTRMDKFELSACGKLLAVVGRFGEIHLLCAKSKELIRTFKRSGEVASVCFSPDSSQLFAHGSDGTVSVWCLKTLKVVHRWNDDGCIDGTCVTVSPSGKYLATGSAQGVVNVYTTKDTFKSKQPTPKKVIQNLTTKISGVVFNPHSEILAVYSSHLPNALRLVHIPSFRVYSNFPEMSLNYGHFATVAFSPNGGYLGIGTNRKLAYLYHLKHYKNY